MSRFKLGEEVTVKFRNTRLERLRTITRIRKYFDYPLYRISTNLNIPLYALDNKQFCKYISEFQNRWCPIYRIYKLEET